MAQTLNISLMNKGNDMRFFMYLLLLSCALLNNSFAEGTYTCHLQPAFYNTDLGLKYLTVEKFTLEPLSGEDEEEISLDDFGVDLHESVSLDKLKRVKKDIKAHRIKEFGEGGVDIKLGKRRKQVGSVSDCYEESIKYAAEVHSVVMRLELLSEIISLPGNVIVSAFSDGAPKKWTPSYGLVKWRVEVPGWLEFNDDTGVVSKFTAGDFFDGDNAMDEQRNLLF